ncbi:oxidoreductase-like protein [Aspergillus ellipticus CBS 707.79]|uniref:Oxidoreductase-like protein n=1 Tax=Aspergillus ellipticus CBS 707.79 TaxID=1448320 RepID=A0A319DDP8_9EURO|nr:oxidoreductase-like protein [Aspergillus ellipticus CBS 707.79]
MTLPQTNTTPFYLPTIDITPYRQDPTSAASKQLIHEIRTACTSTGFFILRGHGIAPSLQKSLFDASAKFFALPTATKLSIDMKKTPGFVGYDAMASQSYEADVLPDLKEGYFFGTEAPVDDPEEVRHLCRGRNVFPPTDVLSDKDFRVPLQEYYAAVRDLGWLVMDLVAATLPYGPDVFEGLKASNPNCPLRLLHYPPSPAEVGVGGKGRQLGSSAHTDFGAVTLLLQDGHAGLEVLDRATGEWVCVPPDKDTYVVNLGDMIRRLTGEVYQSSLHRVMNRNETDRYSVVLFVQGNLDFRLRRLDGKDGEGEEVPTVREHLRGRLTRSYKVAPGSKM